MGKGRSSTDCGIGVMRGTELRKGLPFTSPALCTEDAEGGEDMHYLFRTKHPKTASLTAGCTRGAIRYRYRYRYRCSRSVFDALPVPALAHMGAIDPTDDRRK